MCLGDRTDTEGASSLESPVWLPEGVPEGSMLVGHQEETVIYQGPTCGIYSYNQSTGEVTVEREPNK